MDFEILGKIKNYKTNNKLEEKGALRDLEIILQKLEKGEYEKGFIPVNKFDIVSRTEALFREMEFLMRLGHDWENILKVLPFRKFSKIVDLCPGYTPKIELGLYFLNYNGKIYVLDKDVVSINSLERFINLLNPRFKVIKKRVNLFSPVRSRYDLVLGNHIVDDLVVYYFTNKAGVKLQDFYAREEVAINVWKSILRSRAANLKEITEKITDILDGITIPGGIVCLTQYKSYAEKLFDLNEAYKFNKEIFLSVQDELIERGFVSKPRLISRAFKNYRGHFNKRDCFILQKYGATKKDNR